MITNDSESDNKVSSLTLSLDKRKRVPKLLSASAFQIHEGDLSTGTNTGPGRELNTNVEISKFIKDTQSLESASRASESIDLNEREDNSSGKRSEHKLLTLQHNVSKFSEGLQIRCFNPNEGNNIWSNENLYNKIEHGENASTKIQKIHEFLSGMNIRQVNI